jgi:small subunit ribosomal protein S1
MSTDDKTDDFASMLAQFERETGAPDPRKKKRDPKVGDMVRARIVSIGAEAVFVDLGAKAEGMIDLVELRDADGKPTVKVGDEIEARVVDTSGKAGCVILRTAGLGRGAASKAELDQAAQFGLPVDGMVTGVNKGGVEVQVAGVRGFCPISQLELRHVADAAAYVGQRLQFKITKYDTSGRSVDLVLSRRALLEEEQQRKAAELVDKLVPGAQLSGTVTSLKDYGAFVDLGGIEGMIHVSELGFSRVSKPEDVLKVGQPVTVVVMKITPDERGKGQRIALSLKALEQDPWEDVAQRFGPGTRVSGKVMRVESFGAFVELAPGIEGLLHVSELSGGRQVRHAKELVKAGDTVDVVVAQVEPERRRIGLETGGKADERAIEQEARGIAAAQAPRTLGTFGDLLKKAQQPKKR